MNNQVMVDREWLDRVRGLLYSVAHNRSPIGREAERLGSFIPDFERSEVPPAPIPDAGERVESWLAETQDGGSTMVIGLAQHTRIVSALHPRATVVPDDHRLVSVSWLKHIHRDLDACQKVIWANLNGCDPSYYTEAQDRLAEIDAMLAAAPSPGDSQ